MRNLYLFSTLALGLALLFTACSQGEDDDPIVYADYSGMLQNQELFIPVSGRTVKAYLSKPAGAAMDIVLCMHGGTVDLAASQNAAETMSERTTGGQQFLKNGYAVLSLEYTEFESDGSLADRGIKELAEVLAAIDYLMADSLARNQITIGKIFTFGSSRGGGLALLAGIERPIYAAMSAEGPLDWIATHDSIEASFFPIQAAELGNFKETTAAWGDPHINPELWIKYSPGLRVEEFKCPFLVISGEQDVVILLSTVLAMKKRYEDCVTCVAGSEFILHPFGHTDWGTAGVLEGIERFMAK